MRLVHEQRCAYSVGCETTASTFRTPYRSSNFAYLPAFPSRYSSHSIFQASGTQRQPYSGHCSIQSALGIHFMLYRMLMKSVPLRLDTGSGGHSMMLIPSKAGRKCSFFCFSLPNRPPSATFSSPHKVSCMKASSLPSSRTPSTSSPSASISP